MSSKLLVAVAALALLSTAQSVGAPAAHTPNAAGISHLLQHTGETARVVAASCERRPSQLFGPDVYRCRVEAERPAASPGRIELNLTLASHDGGWVIVAR